MNNVGKATFAILMAVFGLSSWATNYIWTGNGQENNWADPNNYDPVAVPGIGDEIQITNAVTIALSPSDAASWAVANAVSRIRPMLAKTTIEVTVGKDDGDEGSADLLCEVNASKGNSWDKGILRKLGDGALRLKATAQQAYYVAMDVQEGDLYMPQDLGHSGFVFIDKIHVEAGARYFTAGGRASDNQNPITVARGLSGEGIITNISTSTSYQPFSLASGSDEVFDGVIGGNIKLSSMVTLTLTNPNSTFSGTVAASGSAGRYPGGPMIRTAAFGKKGEPSPLGMGSITMQQSPNGSEADDGGYLYLGKGETTDKSIIVYSKQGLPFIDAGTTGGLVLAGDIKTPTDWHATNASLLLAGEGTEKENVVSGAVRTVSYSSKNYTITNLVKRGAGTWRLADNPNMDWSGMLTVEEGTLRFDSIAPKGSVCSLGTAAVAEPYSIWLKGGMLEYTGTSAVDTVDRTIGISGAATVRTAGGPLTLRNVTAAMEGATLAVNGDGMTLSGVTGDLSIHKTGTGTVKLLGDQTFEGELKVSEGVVTVDLPKFTWYRFDFKHAVSATIFWVGLIGLYDAEGHCQSLGLTDVNSKSFANIEPGSAWRDGSRYGGSYGAFANMFADTASPWSQYLKGPRALSEDEADWATVVIRLPDDAPPIASYDLMLGGSYQSNPKNQSCDVHSLKASVDGKAWVDVGGTNTYKQLACNYQWLYGNVKYEAGDAAEHTTGCPIPARPAQLPTQLNNCTVNVSKDATLKAGAEGMTISKLRLDAAGIGTIEGFSLADEGTIDFANVAKGTRSLTFTIPGMDAAEVDKIAGWTFTVNDETSTRWFMSVRNGEIVLTRAGLVIMVN